MWLELFLGRYKWYQSKSSTPCDSRALQHNMDLDKGIMFIKLILGLQEVTRSLNCNLTSPFGV